MHVPIEYLKYGDKIKVLTVAGMHKDEVAELPRGTYFGTGNEPGTIRVRYPLDGPPFSYIEATSWMLVALSGEEDADPITDIGEQVLRRRIADLERKVEQLDTDNRHVLRATGIIETALHEYGRDYDRVDDVNELIDGINKSIKAECGDTMPLEKIKTEFRLSVIGTLTIAFETEVTVDAEDEDDARQQFEDYPEDYSPLNSQTKMEELIKKSIENYYDIEATDLKVESVE